MQVRTDPSQLLFSGIAPTAADGPVGGEAAQGAQEGAGAQGANLNWDDDLTDPVCSKVCSIHYTPYTIPHGPSVF
jgi:hypothetical protein